MKTHNIDKTKKTKKKDEIEFTESFWYSTPLGFMYCEDLPQLKREVTARRARGELTTQTQRRTVKFKGDTIIDTKIESLTI